MMKTLNSLSIILPAYNEEDNIYESIINARDAGLNYSNDFEIIVVNDGSKDKTKEILEKLLLEIPNLIVINQENKGYGGAIKAGFHKASKDWIFFTDSDLQFDINEISKLIEYSDGYDFIFGYRIKRADKFNRIIIAKLLKIWNLIILGLPLSIIDIDCAFKLFKTDSFRSIGELKSNGAMVSTELILRVLSKGFKIKQIGVNHFERKFGNPTGNNFKIILKAIKETFVIRRLLK